MTEPLLLQAELHEKMWGGTALADFGFDLPSDHTGEAWVIAAHQNGQSTVINGGFAGQTLGELWEKQPELFGGHATGEAFPLLIKILDANDDLSIQVHPDDAYARTHGDNYGKTESWYILSAQPGAKLYYGHSAQTREELAEAVKNGHIDDVLKTVDVHAGDFFYVPAGTLHALGAGVLALETQQSSDLTYRFYDFDRVDATTGQKRDLQIDQAVEVTTVPDDLPKLLPKITEATNAKITQLVAAQYFTVNKLDITGQATFTKTPPYTLQTVIDGAGELQVDNQNYTLKKGTSFLLPVGISDYALVGDLTLIQSFVTE